MRIDRALWRKGWYAPARRMASPNFGPRPEGAAIDAGFPVGGIHHAPEMEEGELRDAEAGEGLFEAAAEVGGGGAGAFGGGVEREGRGGHGAEGFAEDVLALIVAIVGGGVEIGDSGAARGVQNGDAVGVVLRVGQAHAAEADNGQLFAGCSVGFIEHGKSP